MSELTVYPEMEQRSEAWFAARCGLVTASAVGKLVTPTLKVADNETSRGTIATIAAERITGHVEESATTFDMMRGIEHEPYARDAYTEHCAPGEVTEIGFMTRNYGAFTIGLSPDGLVGDDGLLEIKCPRAKGHVQTILNDAVPAYYMAQCQTALLVSERPWLHFVSFVAGMPLFVKRVEPDPAWQAAILDATEAAEQRIGEVVDRYQAATKGLPNTEPIPEFEEMRIA